MSESGPASKTKRRIALTPVQPADIDPLRTPVYLAPVTAPAPWKLVGRVFAYLGLTLVWLVVLGIVVFGTIVALPGALSSSEPLGTGPMIRSGNGWGMLFVMPLIVAPIWGYITVFTFAATTGVILSAATLFVRSVNPAYRHEQLSMSTRSRHGEAVGPMSTAFTGVAISLLPVRMTRWTKIAMMVQFNGWIISGPAIVIGWIWAVLYFFTLTWMLWPATGVGVPICASISGLLFAWMLIMIWRYRQVYPTVMPRAFQGTVYARSWPNRPVEQKKPEAGKKSAARTPAARKAAPGE